MKTRKFSKNFPSSLRKNINEITVTPNVSSSPQWRYISHVKLFQFSLTFLQNVNLTRSKIPWLSPDLEECFSPKHFLTCGNPGVNFKRNSGQSVSQVSLIANISLEIDASFHFSVLRAKKSKVSIYSAGRSICLPSGEKLLYLYKLTLKHIYSWSKLPRELSCNSFAGNT